ncbi:MAG: tRNA 2-selenouridine(34) synthase MnmH [Rubrivivax sp.]
MTVEAALAAGFDDVIDVRSPSEFAVDHLPGALNWPVLDDEERARVGTLYVQTSPLAARKLGAALVARRIGELLLTQVQDRPREWRPLVYCWRGGQRSGSLALVLAQIGFRTAQLQGGYKAFRAHVRTALDALPARFAYRVLCGRTGSGKTRLLQALREAGAQVLDLEGLACHRGSILGALPGQPQPTQKAFDTAVWQALAGFDAARPVFVESESARIGSLRVPEPLLAAMHGGGQCLRVDTDDAARIALLLDDYRGATQDPEPLCRLLDGLIELRGRERVGRWQALARGGQWPQLAAALMAEHYDPLYERSMRRSYPGLAAAPSIRLQRGDAAELAATAAGLMQESTAA